MKLFITIGNSNYGKWFAIVEANDKREALYIIQKDEGLLFLKEEDLEEIVTPETPTLLYNEEPTG